MGTEPEILEILLALSFWYERVDLAVLVFPVALLTMAVTAEKPLGAIGLVLRKVSAELLEVDWAVIVLAFV